MAKSRVPLNAWREVITRIFEGFETEYNVTPDWLVNPDTNRKLKLDLLYPQIGMAIRFQGLRAKQQKGPLSLKEKLAQRKRDERRREVCDKHGTSLAVLNLAVDEPEKIFAELELAMSKASRRLARDKNYHLSQKMPLVERLIGARAQTHQFAREIKTTYDLKLYADLWLDRQFREAETTSSPGYPSSVAELNLPVPELSVGMIIEHTHFGPGLVQTITASGGDSLVVIDFGDLGQKTFMASLLSGKVKFN